MNRRTFLCRLTLATLAAPLAADAQQPGLGWVPGQNLTVESRYAEDNLARLPDLAAELVQLNVSVILALGTPASFAAKHATATIPIVMFAGDPVGTGLVASLALVIAENALNVEHRSLIVNFTAKNRLPTVFGERASVGAGGLMSYGTDFADLLRRVAVYVDKILEGAKPTDLPVEQPTKFELVINLKTAKALGLTIPQSILVRASLISQISSLRPIQS